MTKFIFTLLSFLVVNCLQAQFPTITSFSPSSGSVGSLVTITGTNLSNPTSVIIGGVNALPISNTGTSLVAMVMPGAVTGLVKIYTVAGYDSSGSSSFTVVASLLPNTQMGSKLVGTGVVGNAYQGISVDISANGNTAIVGGYSDNSGQGCAWIYVRNAGIWSQQGSKLIGTGNIGAAEQGWAVSISADGNTAVMGGHNDNSNQGAVWVFTRNAGVWTQQGTKLVGTGNIGAAQQGYSVSISDDGNTILTGGNADNSNQGAVWVFMRNAGIWSQQGNKLIGSGNVGAARQGWSVGVSADGNAAIIGGYNDNNGQGAAWIFTRSGGNWAQQGNKLIGTGNVGPAYQGRSVSISADGNTVVTGGFFDNSNQGAAWVFIRNSGVWSQQGGKLVGTGVSAGYASQGYSVSVNADGNAIVSSGIDDNNGKGAVWVFTRNGNIWSQQGSKLVGTGAAGTATQGYSLCLSANGNTAIVGGYNDNVDQGAAWIFSNPSLPVTITSFHAFQKNTGIQVEWNTQNEINLNSYEVEKSTNGSTFTKAGTVIATGLSTYNLLDANPTNGNNYYRLKMIDKDGSFKYSSIVNVKIGSIKNVFTIAGNPIKNNTLVLQMENVEKGSYAASIYNNLGQLMMSKTIVHEGGSSTQTITLGNVSAGTYQLSIIGSNVKVSKRIVIE